MPSALGVGAIPRPRHTEPAAGAASAPAEDRPSQQELERSLAALALVDLPEPEPEVPEPYADGPPPKPVRVRARLVAVTQMVAIGTLLLLVASSLMAARSGDSRIHPVALAGWGFGAALSAVAAAVLLENPGARSARSLRRKVFGAAVVSTLVVTASGVVAAADGVDGPAWVLFVPLVVLCGAALGPRSGLVVGAAAAGGLWVATALSHGYDVAGAGRLVVLLPALPAVAWASGALAAASADAAVAEAQRQQALENDVTHLSELLAAVAAGDLTQVPSLADPGDTATGALAVVLADTLLSLRRLVRRVAEATEQVVTSGDELATAAATHVDSVHVQASGVAETTRTVEQLAATAVIISDIAVKVSQYAGRTREDVTHGTAAVHASTEAMRRIDRQVGTLVTRASVLDRQVEAVAESTQLIEHIARRTTMLAVNASIEAARARDEGIGFATVAEEIRTLATRAREATGRIRGIVQELHEHVAETVAAGEEGVDAVRAGLARQAALETVLRRITSMVDGTTAAAREIAGATREQRAAADAVVTAMSDVTSASGRAREATSRHAVAADRLHDLAVDLRHAVGGFTLPPAVPAGTWAATVRASAMSPIQPSAGSADAFEEAPGGHAGVPSWNG